MLTKADVETIKNLLKPLHKDIKKINKNMERDFGFHETQNLHVIRNVQSIQKNLGIPIMPTVAS